MNIGLILLAAGSSSRMGQSKQLLKIDGEPLLVHIAKVAVQSGIGPVIAVLGANEAAHRKIIEPMNVKIVVNPGWETGMGSSIKTGLRHLIKILPDTEAAMIMVCDQPLLTSDHLQKLTGALSGNDKLVSASHYSGTAGVPALFHRSLFPEILAMSDDEGAKKIIQQHLHDTVAVNFPEGAIDLDTQEDHDRFLRPG